MWETYGLWVWLPAFLLAGAAGPIAHGTGSTGRVAFLVIGVAGAVGCIAGGALSARYGKRAIARLSVVVSFVCSLLAVAPVWVTLLVWGASVISNSPLYSALTGDLAVGKPVGTALALQMGVG